MLRTTLEDKQRKSRGSQGNDFRCLTHLREYNSNVETDFRRFFPTANPPRTEEAVYAQAVSKVLSDVKRIAGLCKHEITGRQSKRFILFTSQIRGRRLAEVADHLVFAQKIICERTIVYVVTERR